MTASADTHPASPHGRRRARSTSSGRARHVSRLLTVDEAAEALNTNPRFVRRLIAERRIVFHRIGRHIRIGAHDLEAFVAAGRVEAEDVVWRAGKAHTR